MEEDYKVNLTFVDEETFTRFWGKVQPLLEECNISIKLNDKAREYLMDEIEEAP